jgi:hypothetical protein
MNLKSSLVQSVTRTWLRASPVKLCFGRRILTARPSAIRVLRTHPLKRGSLDWGLAYPSNKICRPLIHIAYLTSHISIYRSACDKGEPGKEPLREGVDRVAGRVSEYLATAYFRVEAEEVFYGGQIRSLDSISQAVFPEPRADFTSFLLPR